MADPIVIPEMPGGWCATQESLTTFVELININFQIIVEAYNETFTDELVLPGVPPVTIWMPGVQLPGVNGFSGEYVAKSGLEGRAFTGNRYPWNLGGDVKVPYQFQGHPEFNVPGFDFTIPGRDPMTVVMEFVRMNYEIITKKLEERSLVPVIDWSTTFIRCDTFKPDDFNDTVTNVVDVIEDSDPDGPPVPGSEIPTFGPGSGTDPNSCWIITGGTLTDLGGGTFGVHRTGPAPFSIELKCSCGVPGDGSDWTWGAFVSVDPGAACISGNAITHDADCDPGSRSASGSGVCLTSEAIGDHNIGGGFTTPPGKTLTFTMGSDDVDATFSNPFIDNRTAAGSPCGLCGGGVTALAFDP